MHHEPDEVENLVTVVVVGSEGRFRATCLIPSCFARPLQEVLQLRSGKPRERVGRGPTWRAARGGCPWSRRGMAQRDGADGKRGGRANECSNQHVGTGRVTASKSLFFCFCFCHVRVEYDLC